MKGRLALTLVAIVVLALGVWSDLYGGNAEIRQEAVEQLTAAFAPEGVAIYGLPRVMDGETTIFFSVGRAAERHRADVQRDGSLRIDNPQRL